MAEFTVTQAEYHRNGMGGVGFYACRLIDQENGEMIATVFMPEGDSLDLAACGKFFNPMVAVYSVAVLPDVTFGRNSWRGDNYAHGLFDFIAKGDGFEDATAMFSAMVVNV